jgi:hypothetical protein
MGMKLDHTDRLMANSDSWLHNAETAEVSENSRVSFAFVAGYNALQSVQPLYKGPLEDHPLPVIVEKGAELIALSEADRNLGLRLQEWEYTRYFLEPKPVTVDEAIAWAKTVREAALKFLASAPPAPP